jgi:DNA-binding NtrC family response regulator
MKERSDMSTVKVMIIDDDASIVESLKKCLSRRDLSVITALSGEKGLEKLSQDSSIDIVILDVAMPGIDGIQTLREIKRDFPLVEVIMLAELATVKIAIEGMRLGAYDYHVKPCHMDSLVAQVAAAEARKAQHEEKILAARIREIAMREET